MEIIIIWVFITFFSLHWLVETGLLLINIKHIKKNTGKIPAYLSEKITPEQQQKSESYTLTKSYFSIITDLYANIFTLFLLFSGILVWLNNFLLNLGLNGYMLGIGFLLSVSLCSSFCSIPFELYSNFIIEAKFGFNKLTFKLWLSDLFKGLILSLVIGIPILYGILWFMESTGEYWWIWVLTFLTIIELLILYIYPQWIAPWFNKFTLIEDGDLKDQIFTLADQMQFKLANIFIMDGSKRSKHSNAYFTGFGKTKRIVLFDTLKESLTNDEIVAVLAHEIAHYKLKHIRNLIMIGMLIGTVSLYILSRILVWPELYQAFGFIAPVNYIGLQLFSLCFGSFTFFLSPLMAAFSRRQEFAADRLATITTKKGEHLISALIKLNQENLSNLHPHPLYSAWNYSHPTLSERIAAITKLD